MASIGGTTCSIIRGPVPGDWQTQVVLFDHPGLDGTGSMLLGRKNSPKTLQAQLFAADFSSLVTWHRAIRALAGTLVTVVTDTATTTNCLVTQVGELRYRPFYVNGLYAYEGIITVNILAAFYN